MSVTSIANGPIQSIALDTTVHAVVSTRDPKCDDDLMSDAPDPCVRFRITATRTALVSVDVSWDGPARLTLWMNGTRPDSPGPSMSGRVQLSAGDSLTFAVALHSGASQQPFVLIAHET